MVEIKEIYKPTAQLIINNDENKETINVFLLLKKIIGK